MTKRFENLGKHRWLNSKAEPVVSKVEPVKPPQESPPTERLRDTQQIDSQLRSIGFGAISQEQQYWECLRSGLAQQAAASGQSYPFGVLGSIGSIRCFDSTLYSGQAARCISREVGK